MKCMLPSLAWTLTPRTFVLGGGGQWKSGESDGGGGFGRKEVVKERGEDERVSLEAIS